MKTKIETMILDRMFRWIEGHRSAFFRYFRKRFVSKRYYEFNLFLLKCVSHALGIKNCESAEESGEQLFLREYLTGIAHAPVVFDVGANEGSYSLMCEKVSAEAEIYAFEPNPLTFEKLTQMVELKNTKFYNFGLSDVTSEAIIYDSAQYNGSSHASLYADVLDDLHGYEDRVELKIKLESIDTFVERTKGIKSLDLLKIDTEGHELRVLQGAKNILLEKRVRCIQFEINEMNVVSHVFLRDFIKLLTGFSFYVMLPDGLCPLNYKPENCEFFAFRNIVAFSDSTPIPQSLL